MAGPVIFKGLKEQSKIYGQLRKLGTRSDIRLEGKDGGTC